jgi:hypothetical protein
MVCTEGTFSKRLCLEKLKATLYSIQPSACAGRHYSKATSRHPGRNQGNGVRCRCSDAVMLSSTMRTGGFELGSSALTSSTLKWLHRIQCGFNSTHG